MNIADIEEVKKSITAEVQKILEKQNKETANIMNLKINECLQTEMKKCIYECENQLANMKNAKSLQDKELKHYRECNEVLKNALQTQEQYNRSIFDLKNKLQQKISVLEGEHILNSEKVKGLASRLEEKESELSQQMSITLETRKEKDRLQERLKSMQHTLHNIGKEATGRSAPAAGSPELDKRVGAPQPKKKQKVSGCVVPKQPSQRLAEELNDILSDSDSEIDMRADPAQVNRNIDAKIRGERCSPVIYRRRRPMDIPPYEVGQDWLQELRDCNTKRTKCIKIFKNIKRSDNKTKKLKNVE